MPVSGLTFAEGTADTVQDVSYIKLVGQWWLSCPTLLSSALFYVCMCLYIKYIYIYIYTYMYIYIHTYIHVYVLFLILFWYRTVRSVVLVAVAIVVVVVEEGKRGVKCTSDRTLNLLERVR